MNRFIVLCLIGIMLTGMALGETPALQPTQKEIFEARETASYIVDVPNRGPMRYYAQNDPLFDGVKYEARKKKDRKRKMATGACVPTSFSMALANLLPAERLPELSEQTYLSRGVRFCACSCGPFHCNGKHEQYTITSKEEYERYLPLVIASYACGNGPKGTVFRRNKGGTSTNLIKTICSFYGMTCLDKQTHEEALAGISQGAVCIISTGSNDTPFAKGGHYMVLASYDDEYLYILDPMIRDSYKETDKEGLLKILNTGLIRARRTDLKKLCLTSYMLIFPPETV